MAFRIRQKHNRKGTSKHTKIVTAKLSTISHRENFEQDTDSALAQWEEKESSTPDREWATVQQVVYNTAKTYLGKPERKHQDWFDPNAQELQTRMNRRDKAHQRVLQTRSTRATINASIVTIYKKGDRTDCENYRRIFLLSIAGKIFARIHLNKLSTNITPQVVP